MPFINDPISTRSFVGNVDARLETSASQRDFFQEILPDAFRMENSIGSLLNQEGSIGEWDADYDFMQDMPEEHADFVESYAKAYNREDLNRIRKNIEDEIATRQRLNEDGGWGVVGMLSAGIFDPINFVPFGGAMAKTYKAGKILNMSAAGMGAGFGGSVIAESALQSTQLTRRLEESAINIAAGTFLGGVIGGSIGTGKYLLTRKGNSVEDILRGVENDMDIGLTSPMGGGAAAADSLPTKVLDDIERALDADIKEGKVAEASKSEEFIQRVYEENMKRKGIKTNLAVDGTLKIVGSQDPTLRLIQSKSLESRRVVANLAEVAVQRAGDELGAEVTVPVSRQILGWQQNVYNSLKETDRLYYKYVTGKNKHFGGITKVSLQRIVGKHNDKMSYKQFKEAVGKAMRRNDENAIPEVAELAQYWRKTVFEPLKDAAIKNGLLAEDVSVDTAMSYLNRVYKKELIEGNRAGFIDVTANWLTGRQAEAQTRLGTFEEDIAKLRQEARTARQEIKDIETAVGEGVTRASREETEKAIDAALARMEEGEMPAVVGRTPEEKATAAATKAGRRKFVKELTDEIDDEVRTAINEIADDAVESAVAKAADDDAFAVTALREDIAEPLPREGGEAGVRAVDEKSLGRAADEAAIAAQKAFEKSLKAQEKSLLKLADEVGDEGGSAARTAAMATVRAEVRKAAQKASRQATKVLREELDKKVKAIAERRRLSARDEFEVRMDAEDMRDLAGEIADRITGVAGMRLPYDVNIADAVNKSKAKGSALAGPFKTRSFTIPDEMIEEFLESDVEVLGRMITRSMAPDIEIAAKFGDINMTAELKKVSDEWAAIGERRNLKMGKDGKPVDPNSKAAKKWARERDRDINDIEGIRDRLRGVYGVPDNPMQWRYRVGAALRQINYLRLLGGMTLSAIPDVGRPVMVHGFKQVFGDALIPMIKDFNQYAKLTADLRQMGLATDMLMNSRSQALADVGEELSRHTVVERGLQAASDTFGSVSLMSPWNTAFKQLAGSISHGRLIRAMRAELAGNISKKELGYLRENYINLRDSESIIKQIDKHGHKDGKFEFSHADKWDDANAYNVFKAALGRDIDRTIVTPGQDQPLLASQPGYRHLFQFKSFAIAATQRILLAGLQQKDAAVLNGLALSVGLGMLSYYVKQSDAGRPLSNDPSQWLMEGIDRSGVMGWMFEAHNVVEKVTRGHIGLGQFTGREQMSRYASRNAVSALLGPTYGTAATAIGVIGSAADATLGDGDWSQKDTHALRRLMPYQNLMGLRQMFDKVEEGTHNFLGGSK